VAVAACYLFDLRDLLSDPRLAVALSPTRLSHGLSSALSNACLAADDGGGGDQPATMNASVTISVTISA
jgi:hypothetical protein